MQAMGKTGPRWDSNQRLRTLLISGLKAKKCFAQGGLPISLNLSKLTNCKQ